MSGSFGPARRRSPSLPAIDTPELPDVASLPSGAIELSAGVAVEDRVVTSADAVDAVLRGVRLSEVVFSGVRLTAAHFAGIVATDTVFEDCELSGSTWADAELKRTVLRRCRMSGFVAPELRTADVTFDGAKLDEAWLRMATLARVEFVDCDLRAADLYSTQFRHCRFTRSTLDGCELSKASFERTTFFDSTVRNVTGADSLRDIVIRSGQVVDFAVPILTALGVAIDDDLEP